MALDVLANPTSLWKYFKTSTGEIILPTDDGTFFTDTAAPVYANHQFYIEFFADDTATTPVSPAGGTITVSGSPLGNIFIGASTTTSDVINAVDVTFPDASYTPVLFFGAVLNIKMTLDSIAGAPFCKAVLFSYD